MIDDALTDQDLRVLPSNHFEKLRGNLEGFHSIRVNQQWRLIFRWDSEHGEADGIYLDDHQTQAGDCRRNLTEEFMGPLGLMQRSLAELDRGAAQACQRTVRRRRNVTAATALIHSFARVFGNSADFWLNVQRPNDLWEVMEEHAQEARADRTCACSSGACGLNTDKTAHSNRKRPDLF